MNQGTEDRAAQLGELQGQLLAAHTTARYPSGDRLTGWDLLLQQIQLLAARDGLRVTYVLSDTHQRTAQVCESRLPGTQRRCVLDEGHAGAHQDGEGQGFNRWLRW